MHFVCRFIFFLSVGLIWLFAELHEYLKMPTMKEFHLARHKRDWMTEYPCCGFVWRLFEHVIFSDWTVYLPINPPNAKFMVVFRRENRTFISNNIDTSFTIKLCHWIVHSLNAFNCQIDSKLNSRLCFAAHSFEILVLCPALSPSSARK